MTKFQIQALRLAVEQGVVFCGANTVGGSIVARVPATVIYALERRGYVKTRTSPDSTLMALPTPAGAVKLREPTPCVPMPHSMPANVSLKGKTS